MGGGRALFASLPHYSPPRHRAAWTGITDVNPHIPDHQRGAVCATFPPRSDGRKGDHCAQRTLTIGETRGNTRWLSNLSSFLPRKGRGLCAEFPSNHNRMGTMRRVIPLYPWVIPYLSPGLRCYTPEHHERQDVRDRGYSVHHGIPRVVGRWVVHSLVYLLGWWVVHSLVYFLGCTIPTMGIP